jgi:MFS family permease
MIIPSVGALVEKEMNITHSLFGLIISMLIAGAMCGCILFLTLSGSKWPARLTRTGIAALVFANLVSTMPFLAALVIGRFLIGFAWGCAAMSITLVLVQHFPRNLHNLFCFFNAILCVGQGLGMYLTPLASRAFGRWQSFSLLMAGISGVLLAASFLRPLNITTEKRAAFIPAFLRCVMQKRVALMIALLAVYCIVETGVSYYFAVCAKMEKGLSLLQASRIVALFVVGIAVGRLMAAGWMRNKPTILTIAGLILTGGALLLAGILAPGYFVPAGALFLSGVFFAPVYPLGLAYAVNLTSENKDMVVPAGNVVIQFTAVFGLLAIGWIGDLSSLRLGIGLFCCLLIVAAVVAGVAGRKPEPPMVTY